MGRSKTIEIRGGEELGDTSNKPRILPTLNIQAESLIGLSSWEDATEPVYTCKINIHKLLKVIDIYYLLMKYPIYV